MGLEGRQDTPGQYHCHAENIVWRTLKIKDGAFNGISRIRITFLAHQTEIATLFAWVIKLHLTQVFSPRLKKKKKIRKTLK